MGKLRPVFGWYFSPGSYYYIVIHDDHNMNTTYILYCTTNVHVGLVVVVKLVIFMKFVSVVKVIWYIFVVGWAAETV